MRNENKSSSYPEINTRKRELCAPYKPLGVINHKPLKIQQNLEIRKIVIYLYYTS